MTTKDSWSIGRMVEIRDALAEALEGLKEMFPYVPDYFQEKWDLDDYIVNATEALAELDEELGR